MNDLIERLRNGVSADTLNLAIAPVSTALLNEAADALEGVYDSLREHMAMVKERDAEIERLRWALEQIKDEVAGNFDSCAYNIAKDALEDE